VVSITPSQTRAENAGSTRSSGVELDLRYAPDQDFATFANVTYTRSRMQHPSNADQDGTAVTFVPDTVANVGLTLQLPRQITLSSYYHRVGRYYDSTSRASRQAFGNYGVLNMRLTQTWRKGVEMVVDLNNVTNQRYDMPWGFRDPGFGGFAGLNFSF
jgi:outer membrane receptor protein involved in Fe transport